MFVTSRLGSFYKYETATQIINSNRRKSVSEIRSTCTIRDDTNQKLNFRSREYIN